MSGEGEMQERICAFDWSRTPIGPRAQWPASLRTMVDVLTAQKFPMALLWGRDLILIYNDAYRMICQDKHPAALGRSTREIWSEVWHINEPIFAAVMDRGETLYFEDKLFPITRAGRPEEAYFTLCYSPVRIEDGSVGGVLVVLEETTERRKVQKALIESARRYRELFENTTAEVQFWKLIRDEHGAIKTWRLEDVNPAGLRGWGKTRAETIGRTADEIFPGATAHFMPVVRKIFAERAPHSWESYFPGTNQFLHMTSVPFGEYFITTGSDITARKQAEEELRQSHALLEQRVRERTAELAQANDELRREVAEHKRTEAALRQERAKAEQYLSVAEVMMVALDDRARVVLLNRKGCEVLGYTEKELLGKNWFEAVLPPEESGTVYRDFQKVIAGEVAMFAQYENQVLTRSGERRLISWSNSLLRNDAGAIVGTLSSGVDITERKRAEALFLQAQRIETAGRLAGGVAHEFNNLLQGIVGYTEMCRTQVAPDHPIGAHLNAIDDSTIRAVSLIRRLLGFARKQMIAPTHFDLNEHVASFLTLLRRLIGENIDVIWAPAPAPAPVKMDSSQIDQILANLAANSRDAITGVGTITITTANTTLDESCCRTHEDAAPGDYVMLAFSDTGCGMDEGTVAHLFEPFFTTKGVGKGTGLGLATIYGIVKQNNGHVTVESQAGKGTTFRIYLPRCACQGPAPAVTVPEEPAAPDRRPTPPRGSATVLIVDDEPTVLRTGQALLKALGYTVLAAASPEEALRMETEHAGPIDLLLTDVIMPDMDGHELASRLAARRSGLKCIFMSGYPADVLARRGISQSEADFLAKPFTRDQLAGMVREVLNRSPLQSPGGGFGGAGRRRNAGS